MDPIYTLGHSNHASATFLEILNRHGIRRIADVRRYPFSRRWPQFNSGALAKSLASAGVAYRHFEDLGGMRPATPESARHAGLEIPWQRDYAAYMNTPPHRDALRELVRWGLESPTAILCAEASPNRCHRLLLSDALLQAGVPVIHLSVETPRNHRVSPSLRKDGDGLVYDQGVLPFT